MLTTSFKSAALLLTALLSTPTLAATYLNNTNSTVTVGAGTSEGTFNNTFSGTATIEKVIDAPSADAEEFHNQATHIWYTANEIGGGLELLFDFQSEYDITTLHFWNYTSESYDVDNVSFTFFNGSNDWVGALDIMPELGSSPGITAQDITLPAPLNVRYVNAFLTGSNRQVDFQNIGFTANVSSPVPEPSTSFLFTLGALTLLFGAKRRKTTP